jgi:hypothetical protein
MKAPHTHDSDNDEDEDRESSMENSSLYNDGNMGSSGADLEGEKEVEALIDAEDKSVRFWRMLVALTLISTAILVTIYTHKFLKDQERMYFETSVSEQRVNCVVCAEYLCC